LRYEICGKVCIHHPLFTFLRARNGMFFRHLCCDAMTNQAIQTGEVIFNAGDACKAMRFVTEEGLLKYLHSRALSEGHMAVTADVGRRIEQATPHSMHVFESDRSHASSHHSMMCSDLLTEWLDASISLASGQFLSEAAVWTLWENAGMCVSASWSSLILLNADGFEEVLTQHPEMHWMAVLYARQFILVLNRTPMSDVLAPPSVDEWEPEAVDVCSHAEQDLPWEDELPSHLSASVVKEAVKLSQKIAAEGLDENRPHHGFTVIVGDEQRLASCGRSGFNPFHGHDLMLVNKAGTTDKDVFDTLRRNAFHSDGAIVLDGRTGKVVASGWFVGDIRLGGSVGGARSRSAKAVAQQGGNCYVIKCSEDSRGKLVLHLGTNVMPFKSKLRE